MRLLLIHQAFTSPEEPGGTRHYELAGHLIELGHRVTIVASDLSYLTGNRVHAQPKFISEQDLGGVRILRHRPHGEIRCDIGKHQGEECERRKHEGAHRRTPRHRHQPRIGLRRADKTGQTLDECKSKCEAKRKLRVRARFTARRGSGESIALKANSTAAGEPGRSHRLKRKAR